MFMGDGTGGTGPEEQPAASERNRPIHAASQSLTQECDSICFEKHASCDLCVMPAKPGQSVAHCGALVAPSSASAQARSAAVLVTVPVPQRLSAEESVTGDPHRSARAADARIAPFIVCL